MVKKKKENEREEQSSTRINAGRAEQLLEERKPVRVRQPGYF